MPKLKIKEGTTSKLVRVFIQNSSLTTGVGLTGLVFNSAGLTAYYLPEGDASPTAITLATMTVGTWATGGFKEVDATNMPGVYEVGLPNAVIDNTSQGSTLVMLRGATNMVPVPLEIELDVVDYRNAAWARFHSTTNAVLQLEVETAGVTAPTATAFTVTATTVYPIEGRTAIFTSGSNIHTAVKITGATLDGSNLRLTVEMYDGTAMDFAPGDGDLLEVI